MATVVLISALTLGASGCEKSPPLETAPSPVPDTGAPAEEPSIRIVVLGDSLAAGLGLAENAAFPAVVETILREAGHDVEVVNAGVSGDTTAGGLSRLGWVLRKPAEILVIELGGNDALRGQPLENTEANLREIIRLAKKGGAAVILLGMDVPTNYGPEYGPAFAELYTRVAEESQIALVPGFVHELGEDQTLLQPDGLHPTAEGQRRLAEKLAPTLIAVLETD